MGQERSLSLGVEVVTGEMQGIRMIVKMIETEIVIVEIGGTDRTGIGEQLVQEQEVGIIDLRELWRGVTGVALTGKMGRGDMVEAGGKMIGGRREETETRITGV